MPVNHKSQYQVIDDHNQMYKEFKDNREESAKAKVLRLLMDNREKGVTNICFSEEVTPRYGSILYTLRDEGWEITVENVSNGLTVYYLINDRPKKVKKRKISNIDKLCGIINTRHRGVVSTTALRRILDEQGLQLVHKPNRVQR